VDRAIFEYYNAEMAEKEDEKYEVLEKIGEYSSFRVRPSTAHPHAYGILSGLD
jgi:hypothetical protein